MTAIASTGVRSTVPFGFDPVPLKYEGSIAPVMTGMNVRAGGIAVVATTGGHPGYYRQGITGLSLLAMGITQKSFDNTLGSDGSVDSEGNTGLQVRSGAWFLPCGTSTDAITQANVGQMAWIIDDQTVGLTDGGGTRSPAGPILGFDTVLGLPLIGIGPAFLAVSAGAASGNPKIQTIKGVTLVAGTATVNTGITLTTASVITPVLFTPGAAVAGARYKITARTNGAAGTATFTVTACDLTSGGALVNTDISVLDFVITG